MATAQKKIKQAPRAGSSNLFKPQNYPWVVFVFSVLIYFNSTFNGYNLDDELVVTADLETPHRLTSKGISAIPEIFTSPYYEDQAGYKYEYRPIVLVTFAIENSLFGNNPFMSHLINVLLYGLMCVLLLKVLTLLLTEFGATFILIAVLLFAAHPIHTEVVASIKNRDEILALTFSLLALYCAALFVQQKKWVMVPLVPALFYVGILSKSTAIIFAVLIPVMLILFTQVRFRHLLMFTLLLAVPMLAYARLYSLTQQFVVVAGLLAGVVGLYFFKSYTTAWSAIRNSVRNGYQAMLSTKTQDVNIDAELSFKFLLQPIVLIPFLLGTGLLTAIAALGIYAGNPFLTIGSFALLAIFFLMVRTELKAILITPITLLCAYAIYQLPTAVVLIEIPVVVFLASQFTVKHKVYRGIVLVNFVVYALTAVLVAKSFFFVTVLLFAAIYDRRLLPVTLATGGFILLVILKVSYGYFVGGKPFSMNFIRIPVLVACFFVLWRTSGRLSKVLPVILVPVMLLLHFIILPPPETDAVIVAAQETYYNINEIKAADLTPVQSVRPLKYIEYPLEKTDPFTLKAGTYMTALGHYLRLIVLPYPMSFYYGYAYIKPTSLFTFYPILVVVIHLLLLALGVFFLRRNPLVAAGLFIYTLSVIIFSGLFIPIPGMMGDRFLLIPSIGFSLLLTWGLFRIFKLNDKEESIDWKALQPSFKYTLAGVLVVYSLVTVARNCDWKDRLTLFKKDINVVEESAQAQNLVGVHLLIASNKETNPNTQVALRQEAAQHFQKAIDIYPEFLNAAYDLGRTYQSLGRMDDAYRAFELARKIDTGFYAPLFNMGVIQDNKGNQLAAIELYEKYLTKYKKQKEGYANLSFAYFRTRQFDKSIETNKRLLKVMPNTYEPTVNIAKTYLEMGQKDSAYQWFLKSGFLNPTEKNIQALIHNLEMELKKK